MPAFEVSLPDLQTSGPILQGFIGPSRELIATTIEPVMCRQYHVNIYLSHEFVIENIVVVEAALTSQSFQCLIGRDVLARGVFTYDGVHHRFRLSF